MLLQLQVTLPQSGNFLAEGGDCPFGINQFLEDVLEFLLGSIGPAAELFEQVLVAAACPEFLEFALLSHSLQFETCTFQFFHVADLC